MHDPMVKSRAEASILDLIDELEALIEDDVKIRFLNRAIWVDVDEFFALTNKIRMALPQEIRRAERYMRDSERMLDESKAQGERIVQEARKEAERIVQEAHGKAAQLTDTSEVTRQATAKAREIMQEAEEHAREIKKGADDYARDVLENMDEYIARIIASIRQGREKLETKR